MRLQAYLPLRGDTAVMVRAAHGLKMSNGSTISCGGLQENTASRGIEKSAAV
jgi:hypothetical protein